MSDNPYKSFIDGNASMDAIRQANRVKSVSDVDPEKASDALRLGEKYELPGPISPEIADELREREQSEGLISAVKSQPGLGKWLENPTNSSIAHDDVEPLASVSDKVKRRAHAEKMAAKERSKSREKHGYLQWALFGKGGPGEEIVDFLTDVPRAVVAGAGKGAGSSVSGAGRLYRMLDETLQELVFGAVRTVGGEDAEEAVKDAVTIPHYIDPGVALLRHGGEMKDVSERFDVPLKDRTFGTDVAGAVGQMGFQIAAFYLTGGVGGTGTLMSQGTDIQADQLLAEDVELSSPEARAAMAVGGPITAITERIGLDRVLKLVPDAIKSKVSGLLWNAFKAGGTEAVTEAAEGIMQNTVTYLAAGVDESLPQYILSGAGYDAAVGGTAGAAVNVLLNLMLPGRRAVLQSAAEQARKEVQEMYEAAKQSALRERSPEKFREAVRAMQGDDAGTVVYVPADAFAELYQEGDQTPEDVAAAMGIDPTEYQQSAASGARMAIPIESYLAHVDDAAHAALADHITFEADGMSLADLASGEVELQVEELRAQTEAKIRQIEEAGGEGADIVAQAREIAEASGLPSSEAEPLSVLMGAMINTMSRRTGMSATEFASAIGGLPSFNMEPVDVTQALDTEEFDALLERARSVPQQDTDVQVEGEAEVPPGDAAVIEYLDNLGIDFREMSNQEVRIRVEELQAQQRANEDGAELEQALPTQPRMTPEGKGRVKVRDAYEAITQDHMDKVGRKLDPITNEADYRVVLAMAASELREQLKKSNSGVGWYGVDTQLAIDMTSKIIPSLATSPDHRDLFLSFAAVFSNGLTPEQAWQLSIEAMEYYIATGSIPIKRVKPDGSPVGMTKYKDKATGKMVEKPKSWGPKSGTNEKQLEFISALVERKGGLNGAIEWLTTTHPRTEINEEMTRDGIYKSGRYKTKADKAGEDTYGFLAFGPKLGRYAMGLYGVDIDAGDTTIDMWYIRTWRRYSGRTLEGPLDPDAGVVGQPKNDVERDAIFRLTGDLSDQFGMKPGDIQAALWFFEKNLLEAQGVPTSEGTNSNGALEALRKRGLDADDGTGSDAADAGAGRTLEQGAQGAERQGTDPGGLPRSGELAGSVRRLETAYRASGGTDLEGLPSRNWVPGHGDVDFHGFGDAQAVAESYALNAGIDYRPPTTYARVNRERAERIAQAFAEMEHNPNDPEVKASYDAMISETIDQFKWIVENTGLTVDFISTGMADPYAASPRLAIVDVVVNNHMWVYPTRTGFGSNDQFDPVDNPLLAETDVVINGQRALANDLFRVVHDYFGHIKEGVGFRAGGEENAWRAHSAMYSDLARRAMTTETRGQNSWVNYGPHGDTNRTALAEDTIFADQKIGLLPEWVAYEGAGDVSENTAVDTGRGDGPSVRRPRPARRADGRVELTHWGSKRGLDALSPEHAFTTRTGRQGADAERAKKTEGIWVDRTYYGLNVGRDDGYQKELGLGPVRYTASIDPESLYDLEDDPADIQAQVAQNYAGADEAEITSRYELAIKTSGYAGYWVNHEKLGMVAAVFDPLPTESEFDEASAEARALSRAKSVASIELKERGVTDTRRRSALADLVVERAGPDLDAGRAEIEAMELFQDGFSSNGERPEYRPDVNAAVEVWRDNPGEKWAAGKRRDMAERYDPTRNPVPYSSVSASARVFLPVSELRKVPGARGERRVPGDYQFDNLDASVRGEGFKMSSPILIQVNHLGDPYIVEGNTRVAVAYINDVGSIPVEVQWLAGSETLAQGLWTPEGIKSSGVQMVVRDPSILHQAASEKPRGSIVLPKGGITKGRTVINLFSGRDLSTSLHELSHYFLEVLRVSAGLPNASPETVQMWTDTKKALGIEGLKDDESIPRAAHEAFAENGERYFGDGKAPSVQLQSSFERFRAWMLQVWAYAKRVLGDKVKTDVDPELRAVLDRMLATDEEIAEQARVNSTERAFDSEQSVGMSPDEWAAYVSQDDKARAEASSRAQAAVVGEWERRKSKLQRTARKSALEEARQIVAEDPLVQAVEVLTNGRRIGADNDNETSDIYGLKIDRQSIIDLGFEANINTQSNAAAGNDLFPRGKGVIYSETDGVSPEAAAAVFGYDTGRELLDDLLRAPKASVAIEAEADRIMKERFGDLLNDGSVTLEIIEGMHQKERGKLLAMELNAIYRRAPVSAINQKAPDRKIIREVARRMMVDMSLEKAKREDLFLAAERRAARDTMRHLAKGDFIAAREAKQRQLINFYLYAESHKLRKEIVKDERLIKSIVRGEDKSGKGRDIDYVRAARVVLSRFGLASEPRGYSFSDWVEDLRQSDPQLLDEIGRAVAVATAAAKPAKELSLSEYRGMMDAVRSLMEAAKSRRTAELNGQKVDIDDAREMILNQLDKVYEKSYLERRGEGLAAGMRDFMLSMSAALRRVQAWSRYADGGDDNGTVTNLIVRPVLAGIDRYRDKKEATLKRALEILKPTMGDAHKGGSIKADELGGHIFRNKGEIIAAILNTGNESNAEALMKGYSWNPAAWDAFIERMTIEGVITKRDFDTVQSIWDLFEGLRPGAQAAHRKIYGHYFDRIPARPLQTPFGIYRGGYVPLSYDKSLSAIGQNVDANRLFDEQQSSAMFPTTGKGFTIKRSKNVSAPVDLSLRMIPSHIDKVLRFTYIQPEVRTVARVLSGHDFKQRMFEMDPKMLHGMLLPWLQRSASQQVESRSLDGSVGWFDGPARFARRSAGATTMVLNYVNALQQFTGFFPALTRVRSSSIARGMATYYMSPGKTTQFVYSRSPFMRRRVGVDAQEAMTDLQHLLSKPSMMKSLQDFSFNAGYVLQRVADRLVAQPIWLAAYNEATERGDNEGDAVAFADGVVRDTQSSFNAEDVSAVEVGSPLKRIFTMFLNYFNAQYNLLATEAGTAVKDRGLVRSLPRTAAVYMAVVAMPAVLAEIIGVAFRGGFEDEDDDGYADDSIMFVVDAQVRYLLAMIPFLGQAANAIWGAFDDKTYNDRVSLSPVTMVPEKIGQAGKAIQKQIEDGDNEARTVKDTLTAIMMLLGIGGGNAIGKAAGYGTGVATGEYRPRSIHDIVKGVSTGREID